MKQIDASLNCDGNSPEAMTFYAQCLDADLHMMAFSDMPGQASPGEDRIMLAALTKGPAMILGRRTATHREPCPESVVQDLAALLPPDLRGEPS